MKKHIEQLHELDQQLSALTYAQSLVEWDSLTLAPKKSVNARAACIEGISTFYFNTLVNEKTDDLLRTLELNKSYLSQIEQSKVMIFRDDYDSIAKIPAKEFSAYQGLVVESSQVWENAKKNNDFDSFAPFLEKVIAFKKNYIGYLDLGGHPYDTLLNDNEKGLTVADADAFFATLQETIVPLVQSISKQDQVIFSENEKYPIVQQEKLSSYLMEKLGFRMDGGVLARSEHPFTINLSRDDVRITTHYYDNDFMSALFSTIHETGHALYEQNINEKFGLSVIATGTSMGIHESQSRIFENNFGKSVEFWKCFYPIMQELFPNQFGQTNLLNYYKGINYVKPSLIRIEADEVTYPLHIMVRYEIEKMIFEDKVKVNELPELWREKYKSYLGVVPQTDSLGVLQDVHWSEGLFGYFPSYALGSAYAAQFEQAMNKQFNVNECLEKGDFSNILTWLRDNIHQYGRTKTPKQIIFDATGENFNPNYFIQYIQEKYRTMYQKTY